MVIKMKEYLVFNIKKEFAILYRNRPEELFYIFNRIYYMKEIDKNYGYNLFEQVCNFYNKEEVNNFIYEKYKDKLMYSLSEDEHIINNLFLNEISVLTVKSSNIKIETNNEVCTFFNDLKKYNDYLFVCNFKEQDYFFLKKYKVLNKS